MQNFIFISPNFPTNYWQFCRELKNNGLNVLGTAPNLDHFGDINEMVLHRLTTVQASQLGLRDHRRKIAEVSIAERLGKLSTRPALDAPRVHTPNAHEYRNVSFHGSRPGSV